MSNILKLAVAATLVSSASADTYINGIATGTCTSGVPLTAPTGILFNLAGPEASVSSITGCTSVGQALTAGIAVTTGSSPTVAQIHSAANSVFNTNPAPAYVIQTFYSDSACATITAKSAYAGPAGNAAVPGSSPAISSLASPCVPAASLSGNVGMLHYSSSGLGGVKYTQNLDGSISADLYIGASVGTCTTAVTTTAGSLKVTKSGGCVFTGTDGIYTSLSLYNAAIPDAKTVAPATSAPATTAAPKSHGEKLAVSIVSVVALCLVSFMF